MQAERTSSSWPARKTFSLLKIDVSKSSDVMAAPHGSDRAAASGAQAAYETGKETLPGARGWSDPHPPTTWRPGDGGDRGRGESLFVRSPKKFGSASADWCLPSAGGNPPPSPLYASSSSPATSGSKPSPASSRMQVKQKVYELYKGTVERVTGPRTVSAFLDKGVLSVPEFILAGDNLVSKCPTWSWEAGDPSKRKPYLPPDKQFLVTRNVPCLRRAVSLEEEYDAAGAEVVLGDDEDGEGWLATHGVQASKQEEEEDIPSMDTLDIGKTEGIKSIPSYFSAGKKAEEEEDIPDMDTYEDSGNDSVATAQPSYFVAEEPEDDNILRTRTYDVSITYDKYYQTPRVWLTGYDESRMPLKPELVFEDISQDHARKTVTIEDHPHLSAGKHASVHPCKHAAVMKKIIDVLMSRGVEPEVDNLWPQSYPLLNMTTLWTSIWAAQADDLLIEGKGKIL
uniref:Autophagy-related protein 3 n=2 Tax=Oryza nivara TaxID=4536 RepID=A0A0E0FHX8_ORYNI